MLAVVTGGTQQGVRALVAKKKTIKVATSAKSAKSAKAGAGTKNAARAKAAVTAKEKKAAAPSKPSSTKKVQRTTAAKTASTTKRKNPRLVQNLLLMSSSELEEHFMKVRPEEIVRLFEESYPSDIVNIFLGLKRARCRQLFSVVTGHRKKAYLDTITLYYYKDYLTNPLPLQLNGSGGDSVPNYYAIVGMARDASEDEIDEASKLLTRAFKPQCFAPGDRKMGDLRLKEIKGAFERLRSPKRRDEVNRILPSVNYFYPKRADSWLEMVQRFAL